MALQLKHLFRPIHVGPMLVPNRIVMSPMERNYANADATVSDRTLEHYGARARGGVGWIDVESTFVDPAGRGRTHQLGLHEDRCIPGFRALAELVHRDGDGTKIGIELHHAGRNTQSAISGSQPVAPSPVPCIEAGGEVPRELSLAEIDVIVERYAAAAARAAEAGFDAIELHSAHGYLPLAFLSPRTNHRTDEYGGTFENRVRFAVRTIAAIKAAVGEQVAVGARFSAEEHLDGGLTLDDTTAYARALERAGVDYLSVSTGVYESFVRIIPPMDFAPGWLLDTVATIKQAVDVPVIGASRIVDVSLADQAISSGQVDLVALGRALLTDPELPRKARNGRIDEIISCIGCNQGCESRISAQRDVTCLVNPACGREREFVITSAPQRKRVVVVGGGPAGIEAARICAERGHEVILYERLPQLGGTLALAARLPQRPGWGTFLEQAERRLRASGVTVRLAESIDETELAALSCDALVFATGAEFDPPPRLATSEQISLINPAQLLAVTFDDDGLESFPAAAGDQETAWTDTARLELTPGTSVVVMGAGAAGIGIASWLAGREIEVHLIAGEPEIVDPVGQSGVVGRLLASRYVTLHPDRQVAAIDGDAVLISRSDAIGPLFEQRIAHVSTVVWAADRASRDGLAWLAHHRGLCDQIVEVGDCRSPRSALEAIYEGAVAGRSI